MLLFSVDNIKSFMSLLLKSELFDTFEVRNVFIRTFTTFEIHCNYNKEFYLAEGAQVEESETECKKYCYWDEIKPYAFEIIKGKKLPGLIKIVFSIDKKTMAEISPLASAMFLNITFENNVITCMTGFSLKNFSLDKSAEYAWDQYIMSFFQNNHISVSTQLD